MPQKFKFDQYYPGSEATQTKAGRLGKGYHNLVDHDNEITWIMIPKNANTSIKSWLNISEFVEDPNKYPYMKVAFVRNPYDRIASVWKWGIRDRFHRTFPQYAPFGITPRMPFDSFVRVVCDSIHDGIADKHFRSQSARLSDVNGVDFIGRVEEIAAGFQELKTLKPGVPGVGGRCLNSTRGEVPWSDDLRAAVYKRFKNDFVEFGYES